MRNFADLSMDEIARRAKAQTYKPMSSFQTVGEKDNRFLLIELRGTASTMVAVWWHLDHYLQKALESERAYA